MVRYDYHSLTDGSIRLLRLLPNQHENAPIHCELFEFPLQTSTKGTHAYEALSYVWGCPKDPLPIFVGAQGLTVTRNLHMVLLHLRDPHVERVLWIDAICINQQDLSERGRQVQTMAHVYAKATRVVVWLGDATDDSDQAMEEIRFVAEKESASFTTPGAGLGKPQDAAEEEKSKVREMDVSSRLAVINLLCRPWFQRIWVRAMKPHST